MKFEKIDFNKATISNPKIRIPLKMVSVKLILRNIPSKLTYRQMAIFKKTAKARNLTLSRKNLKFKATFH